MGAWSEDLGKLGVDDIPGGLIRINIFWDCWKNGIRKRELGAGGRKGHGEGGTNRSKGKSGQGGSLASWMVEREAFDGWAEETVAAVRWKF